MTGCAMTLRWPGRARIEAFNTKSGGGVTSTKLRNGYTLHLMATGAPIARLQPTAWMMKLE